MDVLVAVASRHGATMEIGRTIGEVLEAEGLRTQVLAAEAVDRVDAYAGVVLGSAVYAGHWLAAARELVARQAPMLSLRPVWLFSSGPVGDPPMPRELPVDVADLAEAVDARDHRVFAGKLDKARLGFAERALVMALRAPQGDWRDWQAIREWAGEIANDLKAATSAGTRQPDAPSA